MYFGTFKDSYLRLPRQLYQETLWKQENIHRVTDALTYEIETNDVHNDLRLNEHLFDNSFYPTDSRFFNKSNKKVIGKFKDKAYRESRYQNLLV